MKIGYFQDSLLKNADLCDICRKLIRKMALENGNVVSIINKDMADSLHKSNPFINPPRGSYMGMQAPTNYGKFHVCLFHFS